MLGSPFRGVRLDRGGGFVPSQWGGLCLASIWGRGLWEAVGNAQRFPKPLWASGPFRSSIGAAASTAPSNARILRPATRRVSCREPSHNQSAAHKQPILVYTDTLDGRGGPDQKSWFQWARFGTDTVGNQYGQFSPFGFNGAYYYTRLNYRWGGM